MRAQAGTPDDERRAGMPPRYASLPAMSPIGGPLLFIGDLKAARDMEHDGLPVVTVSAVEPYKFVPTYPVLFEDGMGHEDEDEVKTARKCIRRGAKHIATALSGKGRNRKKKNVLVHCWMGMNRSAAMICAFAVMTLGDQVRPREGSRRAPCRGRNAEQKLPRHCVCVGKVS